jgi:hypothetical protein
VSVAEFGAAAAFFVPLLGSATALYLIGKGYL